MLEIFSNDFIHFKEINFIDQNYSLDYYYVQGTDYFLSLFARRIHSSGRRSGAEEEEKKKKESHD